MSRGVLVILALLLVPLSVAYGETITVTDSDSGVAILLEDGVPVSYSANIGGTILKPVDPKFEPRVYGYVIVDKMNGFFAVLKTTGSEYEIKVKVLLGDTKIVKQYSASKATGKGFGTGSGGTSKTPGQRDLLGDTILDPTQAALREAEAKRRLAANIQLEKEGAQGDRRGLSFYGGGGGGGGGGSGGAVDVVRSRVDGGNSRGDPVPAPEPEPPHEIAKINLYIEELKDLVQWGTPLRYTILVTDDDTTQDHMTLGLIGTRLPNAIVSVVITDPSGIMVHMQNGTTSTSGRWSGTYDVPRDTISFKPFNVTFTATFTTETDTFTTEEEDEFFAVERTNTGDDQRPRASLALQYDAGLTREGSVLTGMFEPDACFIQNNIHRVLYDVGSNSSLEPGSVSVKLGDKDACPVKAGALGELQKGHRVVRNDGKNFTFPLPLDLAVAGNTRGMLPSDYVIFTPFIYNTTRIDNVCDDSGDIVGSFAKDITQDKLSVTANITGGQ
ncbi:MAG: hypothetical protein EB829_00540, partial [Nitrosopumilus sp. H8]